MNLVRKKLNLEKNCNTSISQAEINPPARSLTTEKAANSYDFVMTIKEVGRFTKFSEKKIYRLCKSGQIPHNKIQGQYRFVKAEIERWLKGEAYE